MKIATRGSALALAQARHVAELFAPTHPGAELVEVVTSGDRRRDVDDKREWVAEIEDALAAGDADLAVHSAKDVPAELPEGFALAGAPLRADPWDALCGADSLDALPAGARVGTSSLRRTAALRAIRPDLELVELRGNVDTRLRKLADGEADAIVLALAGLQRLGRADAAGCVLTDIVPAPGQGTLLRETRLDDGEMREACAAISDHDTMRALACERALVRALGADCHTPVGAHATDDGTVLTLRVFVGRVDGSEWLRDELTGEDPEALGAEVAERLLSAGAEAMLR
jgi:hydroxymethylbilane synthase